MAIQSSTPMEELLTINELSAKLKCSRFTLWRRVKDGSIAVMRLGNRIRFRQEDVEQFISSNLSHKPKTKA